jgi:hypothetical protein
MSRIKNVVLLQDPAGTHRELSFHGLRITGFNDPRYFGDDNQDPVAKEKPAVDAYNATLASQPEPDLVVTHEPYAARYVEAGRIVINGHMHAPSLEGNRIQVGTFTGGGVVSHYVAGPGEELNGQPYSFDVLSFGPSCELTSLSRYSFRNLLEGRPAYDSVQVVSGARIDPYRPDETREQPGQTPPTDRRTCGRVDDTTVRDLPTPDDAPDPGSTGRGTAPATPSRTPGTTTLPATP